MLRSPAFLGGVLCVVLFAVAQFVVVPEKQRQYEEAQRNPGPLLEHDCGSSFDCGQKCAPTSKKIEEARSSRLQWTIVSLLLAGTGVLLMALTVFPRITGRGLTQE